MSATPPNLTQEQSLLATVLADRDRRYEARLASMFLGAVHALGHLANPDRLAQAALSMRELLDKLPLVSDTPVEARPGRPADRMAIVAATFTRLKKASSCYDEARRQWTGTIDPALGRLLTEIEQLVQAHESTPSKQDRARSFIKSTDPRGRALPQVVEQRVIREWSHLASFFNAVAHHGKHCTAEEFVAEMERCTALLLGQSRVSTFDTQDELDRIIDEAE